MSNILVRKFIATNLHSNDTHTCDDEVAACEYIRSRPVGEKYMILPCYEVVSDADISYRVTIVLPVWAHPQKTIRAIESVLNQDTNGWELLIIGDCCPNLQRLIDTRYFDAIISAQQLKGNSVVVINLPEHSGGFGYKQRNKAREIAKGKYTMYLDNDDFLLPEHVSARMRAVEGENEGSLDLVAFETWKNWLGFYRDTIFESGKIGHAEILIKTSLLRELPESDGVYGHDWTLVEQCIARNVNKAIIPGRPYSYIIMSDKEHPEEGID